MFIKFPTPILKSVIVGDVDPVTEFTAFVTLESEHIV